MTQKHWSNDGLTLFSYGGERKYLSKAERLRFLNALPVLTNPKDRTFAETLFWTGARPSEGLALSAMQIDIDESMIIFRSLKKRGKDKGRQFRAVPVPPEFMQRLARVHDLETLQRKPNRGEDTRLWSFKRTTAYKRVRSVMEAAGISGIRGSARGLRHGFAVSCAINHAPQSTIQRWLGHSSIAVSAIYLEMAAPQDHEIASRMWSGFEER